MSIHWHIIVPLLIVGAMSLWLLGRFAHRWALLIVSLALLFVGRWISAYTSIVIAPNGQRIGSPWSQILPEVSQTLTLLGMIGIVDGIITLMRRSRSTEHFRNQTANNTPEATLSPRHGACG